MDVYQQFMRERGAADKIRVYLSSQDPQLSFQLGNEIFASFDDPDRPTAIYAASDSIAIGLLQAAYQLGITIPDQVSIVGFDNLDITPFTVPPLTTINQSGVEMGQAVARLTLDMIEQGLENSEVDDIILAPTLVVRQSTAPPAKSRKNS